MRVALVIDRLDGGKGGAEAYAVSLTRGLLARGHTVHVFAQGWGEPIEGANYHRLPGVSFPRWARGLSLAVAARRAVPSGGFDVIQGFGGVPAATVHRPGGGAEWAWLRQEIRCREGIWRRTATALKRTLSLKLAVNLLLERAIYRGSAGSLVVANSRKVERDILGAWPEMDARRLRVVHNGVDVQRFHPDNRCTVGESLRRELGLARDTTVILFMAHNFRLKGLAPLLCALGSHTMAGHRWVLLVGGRGRRAPFEGLARDLGIGQRVLFLGQVTRTEAVMAASDVLAYPTFYDPFANVCLEAMAAGLPVITTESNGAAELVGDGQSGYVLRDPRDVGELARRLAHLLDSSARESMGARAREAAEAHPWAWHLERMESVYEEARGKGCGSCS